MRYVSLTLVSILIVFTAVSAYPIRPGEVELNIVSDRGGNFLTIPFEKFRKGKTSVIKNYLEAQKGENYSIEIINRTAHRIGIVIAVDGRNIISGQLSDLENDERMYIVDRYSTVNLEGWRTDLKTVNRFYFTDEKDSYAVKTFRDSSATGVIAAAVFLEKERPHIRNDIREDNNRTFKAPAAPSAGSKSDKIERNSAGTGFGHDTYSPAVKVHFEPERLPIEKILVKYEWREVLCSKGVLTCSDAKSKRLWDGEFAPYPPDYVYQ